MKKAVRDLLDFVKWAALGTLGIGAGCIIGIYLAKFIIFITGV